MPSYYAEYFERALSFCRTFNFFSFSVLGLQIGSDNKIHNYQKFQRPASRSFDVVFSFNIFLF